MAMAAGTTGGAEEGTPTLIAGMQIRALAAYCACTMTCAYNGVVYAFPMLSVKLKAQGLSSDNVVIAGLMLQLGYGLVSYPFARFYMNKRLLGKYSPAQMDRIASIISAAMTLVASGIMIGAAAHASENDVPLSMPLFCIGFALWSAGLGVSFYQSMTIANYIFARDKALRRKAVAFNAFALGVGSLLWVVLFYYAMSKISLVNTLVTMTVMYAAAALFRIKYMVRGRFVTMPPEPSDPAPVRAPATAGVVVHDASTVVEMTSISGSVGANGASIAEDEPEKLSTVLPPPRPEEIPKVVATPRPRRIDYWSSPVVWFTSVSGFFAYGIGSVALNSLGNTAALFVPEDEVDATTFSLSITFLVWIIMSRIVTTLIYAHLNWPHVNTMWNLLLFVGMVVYTAYPTLPGAYLMACLVGFGFGGIISTLAVISTSSFPGGIADNSMNLSIAFTITSFGPFLMGLIKNAIFAKATESGLNTENFSNLSTYIFFVSTTFFSTACSMALGYHLKKAFKLEKQTMRAAALHASPPASVSEVDPDPETPMEENLLAVSGQRV
ncbi:Hypothetical Protein FCC1311_071892 [Hondaea fermentalgiana]|uniref:Uncharacterized protein n=1 Tax=Hondaea fermentalgiana TaxID=2315210 RepID=A0A2R5GMK6_9STRA|nr:Hypothetical Protein FCC1311_071892 [Hondaea fermentalgiana]|eukprot:GBG30968.1 Hypothetical Protein FCC1311_071892 [Hondaea fermentalgiana]